MTSEKIKAYQKAYREANAEKMKAYQKANKEANTEKMNQLKLNNMTESQQLSLLQKLADDVAFIKAFIQASDLKKNDPDDYLTVAEWCEAAKCSRWVWEVLKKENLIPYRRVGPRKIIVKAHTALDYLEGRIKLPKAGLL